MGDARGRGRRRTTAALASVALGTALLTLAVLLVTWVVPSQTRTPLDVDTRIRCTGPGDVLDAATLREGRPRVDRGVPLEYTKQVTVVEPGDRGRITVEIGTSVVRGDRSGDAALVTAALHRVTADRVSAMPVDDLVNGTVADAPDTASTPVHVDGLEVKWPVHTERVAYPFYDANVRASAPMDYVGDERVGDLETYHFRQVVTDADLSANDPAKAYTLPASTFGLEGEGTVRVRTFYTVERDYWVEPTTGTVVDARERIHRYLGRTPGEELVTSFRFTAEPDDDSVARQVHRASRELGRLRTYRVVWPSVLAALGVAALVTGLVLGLRRGRPDTRAPDVHRVYSGDDESRPAPEVG